MDEIHTDRQPLASLREFEQAARTCTNKEWRAEMKNAHVELLAAITTFWRYPTAEKLRTINGLWAFAHKLYDAQPPDASPQPPFAGAPEPAVLAAVAS